MKLKNFAHEAGGGGSGVGFVGVDVHCEREFGADSDDDVVKDELSAVGVDLDGDDLLILKAVFLGVLGGGVDVPLGGDDAALDLKLALGADQFAGAAALDIAALPDGCGNAYRAGVGERKLDLSCGADGAEDGDGGEAALGADDGYSLFAGELAGLGEILLFGQLIAFAEENIESLAADMDVAGGCFNENFFLHG